MRNPLENSATLSAPRSASATCHIKRMQRARIGLLGHIPLDGLAAILNKAGEISVTVGVERNFGPVPKVEAAGRAIIEAGLRDEPSPLWSEPTWTAENADELL